MLFTDGMSTPMGFHFFGGWKVSLCGDHHVHGRGSACFYIKLKMARAGRPTDIRVPTPNS